MMSLYDSQFAAKQIYAAFKIDPDVANQYKDELLAKPSSEPAEPYGASHVIDAMYWMKLSELFPRWHQELVKNQLRISYDCKK